MFCCHKEFNRNAKTFIKQTGLGVATLGEIPQKSPGKVTSLEDLPKDLLRSLVNHFDPMIYYESKMLSKGWRISRKQLRRLKGSSLERLRSEFEIEPKQAFNTKSKSARVKPMRYNLDAKETHADRRDLALELQNEDEETLYRYTREIRGEQKVISKAKKQNKLIKKNEAKVVSKDRTLNLMKLRDSDKFENVRVRRLHHTQRAGHHEHPLKAKHRLMRRQKAAQKAKDAALYEKTDNFFYTQQLIDANFERRTKRQAKRKANKKTLRDGLKKAGNINPESLLISELPEDIMLLLSCYLPDEGSVAEQLIDITNAMITWLYQMYRSRTYMDYLAACNSLLMSLGVKLSMLLKQTQLMANICYRYVTETRNKITPESFDAIFGTIDSIINVVQKSDFLAKIRDFILAIVSTKFLGKDIAFTVMSYLGQPPKGTFVDAFKSIYEGIKFICKFGERVIRGEPLSQVIMSEDPIAAAITEGESLLNREFMTYTGLPVEGFTDKVTYFQQIQAHIVSLSLVDTLISPLDSRMKRFAQVRALIYGLQDRVESSFGEKRTAPVAIVLHGSPGIGKSELVLQLSEWFSESRGRVYDPTHTFTRTLTSDYMEGYSHSKPIIHYSELGNKAEALAKKEGDPLLLELQSLIGTLPFAADMAFTDKGKLYMTPELIIVDTNNKFMHAEHCMSSPDAMLRRFIFVHAVVRPEFRATNGVSIDMAKSLADGSWIMDRYEFTVTVCHPAPGGTFFEETLYEGDIYGLKIMLQRKFEQQFRDKSAIDARISQVWHQVPPPVDVEEGDELKHIDDNNIIAESEEKYFESDHAEKVGYLDAWRRRFSQKSLPKKLNDHNVLLNNEHKGDFRNEGSDDIPNSYPKYESEKPMPNREEMVNAYEQFIPAWQRAMLYKDAKPIPSTPMRWGIRPLIAYFKRLVSCLLWWCIYSLFETFIRAIMFITHINNDVARTVMFVVPIIDLLTTGGIGFFIYRALAFSQFYIMNTFQWGLTRYLRTFRIKQQRELNYLMGGPVYNPFVSKFWITYGGIIMLAGASVYALKLASKKKIEIFETEGMTSEFVTASKTREILHDIEEKMEIHQSRRRVKGKTDQVWNDMLGAPLPAMVNTHGAKQLYTNISKNIMCVDVEAGGKTMRTHMLGISGTLALINTHAFRGLSEVIVKGTRSSSHTDLPGVPVKRFSVQDRNSIHLGDDVTLVDTGIFQFCDITKHIIREIPILNFASGMIGPYKTSIQLLKDGILKDASGDVNLDFCFKYSMPNHTAGHCGLPLLLESAGKSAIIGMHVGGSDNTDAAFSTPLSMATLMVAIQQLKAKTPLLDVMSLRIEPEVKLVEPIKKSPFRYENYRLIEYQGRLDKNVILNSKSALIHNYNWEKIADILTSVGIVSDEEYYPPVMRPQTKDGEYKSPYNVFLRKVNSTSPPLDLKILDKVINILVARIVGGLNDRGITKLTPIKLNDAINGVEDDPFIRRINASTGAGYGFAGKKKMHIPLVDENKREPTPELQDNLAKIFESYMEGYGASPINTGSLKDEARTLKKIYEAATRVFFITPLDFLVISRCIASPLYSLMLEHGDLFGTAIGIDMHVGADDFIKNLFEFSPLFLEGDYSGFDIDTPPDIARAANTVIYKIAEALGYNDYALTILKGVLTDDLFPVMELNTDVFTKPGMVTSGRYATAESNSLRGILLLMYAWYEDPELMDRDFWSLVMPSTFGDDVLSTVKPEVSNLFNIETYAEKCKRLYDMKFTNASKTSNLVPFLTRETCSFLKRQFREYKNGYYVAPLAPSSIHKALKWTIPSRVITVEDQLINTYVSMLYEVFLSVDQRSFDGVRNAMIENIVDMMNCETAEAAKLLISYHEIKRRLIPREAVFEMDSLDN